MLPGGIATNTQFTGGPVTTVSRKYEMDLWTYARITRASAFMLTRTIVPPLFIVGIVLQIFRRQSQSAGDRVWGLGAFLVSMTFLYIVLLIGFSLLSAFVTRLTSPSARGTHSVTIAEDGVRLSAAGQDSFLPWRSVVSVHLTGGCLVLRTDNWVPIPQKAFGSRADLQAAFALAESRRMAAEALVAGAAPAAANPYAAPAQTRQAHRGPVPLRGPAVLVRIAIPPERVSWTGHFLKLVQHNPGAVVGFVLIVALSPVLSPPQGRAVSVVVTIVAGTGLLWRNNVNRRRQMAGAPEIVDVSVEGIHDWLASREVKFGWNDISRASEDAGGFFILAKGGAFRYLPADCIEGGERDRLRELFRQHLGERARMQVVTG
jgi:hypothetical protein